jgi:hypothetical protein
MELAEGFEPNLVRAVQLRLEPSKLASVEGDICRVDGLRVGMRMVVEDARLVFKGFLVREDPLEDRPIFRHNAIQAPQDGERRDDVPLLVGPKLLAQQLGDFQSARVQSPAFSPFIRRRQVEHGARTPHEGVRGTARRCQRGFQSAILPKRSSAARNSAGR